MFLALVFDAMYKELQIWFCMSTISKIRLLTIPLRSISSKGNRLNLICSPDWADWHWDRSLVEAEISMWTRTMVGKHDYNGGLARGSVGTNLSYNSWSPSLGGSPFVCVYLPVCRFSPWKLQGKKKFHVPGERRREQGLARMPRIFCPSEPDLFTERDCFTRVNTGLSWNIEVEQENKVNK